MASSLIKSSPEKRANQSLVKWDEPSDQEPSKPPPDQVIVRRGLAELRDIPTCISDLLVGKQALEVLTSTNTLLVCQKGTTVATFERILQPWLLQKQVQVIHHRDPSNLPKLGSAQHPQPSPFAVVLDVLYLKDSIGAIISDVLEQRRASDVRDFGLFVLCLPSQIRFDLLGQFHHFFIPDSSIAQLQLVKEVIPLREDLLRILRDRPDHVLFYSSSPSTFDIVDNPSIVKVA